MFLSVLELSASTNCDGYHRALQRTWKNSGLTAEETPSKSSLSEARKKVSYEFFEEIFNDDLDTHNESRELYRGFHIYAIDGDQFDLPRSEDLLAKGLHGYPSSKTKETHYLKMYTTQTLDVVNGTIRNFEFSSNQDEVHLAQLMVQKYEKNSISIYDRLHCGYDLFRAHEENENFFIVRARCDVKEGKGRGVKSEVRDFAKSLARSKEVIWRIQPGERRISPDLKVRLVKIKNPRSKQDMVFVTNLSASQFSAKEIGKLYRRRWEIETSFKELTCTLKIGQWHSKNLNGILQEIFALLWLVNATRRQLKIARELLASEYEKSNFKLIVGLVVENICLLLMKKYDDFFLLINHWANRTVERRRRDARSYARVVKHRGREYPTHNLVLRNSR